MGKIDTSEWKEFRVGDLFDIHPTKAYKCTNAELLDGGGTNVVVNSAYDNGIGGTSTFSPTENGNMITFSDTVDANTIFYQESPFVGYPHVQGLYPVGKYQNAWTRGSLQYFVTVFRERALAVGFDYGNKFRRDIAANLFVKLPSTTNGAPDWAYMESYMANLETKVADSLTLLQAAKDAEKKKVDTREWGEFRVGELFEVKISKSVDKGGLEFAEDGEYDFIGRTPLNNGIQGRLNKLKFEANQEGTYSIAQIGMHVCQYRERKWYASQNIFVLTPFAEKSHKANKFIATVITRYLDCAYGEDTYATYPTAKTLPHLKIKLPVDKTGQPDWAYMEEYMKTVQEKTEGMLNQFIST